MKLECGCEFEKDGNKLIMPTSTEGINLECPLVWDKIGQGNTICGFQIDSGLGQTMSKQLKPENIHHLAALIAIMRPSCLQGKLEDGKSIAQHYIDRKNGLEEAKCPYPALDSILKSTYSVMIFQEQALRIGQETAGMSLVDADKYIRAGIGKKKANLISEGEKVFLEGCKKVGKVDEKEAIEIWEWFKSSARYAFNASHSYSYAMTTYLTMLAKVHFPIQTYKSWLNHSYDKIRPLEEIRSLVRDARQNGIDIVNPDLRLKNPEFIIKDGRLYFGLEYVKGVGQAAIKSFIRLTDASDLNTATWTEVLFKILINVNKEAVRRLIAVGALDYLKIDRERLLFEHDVVLKLTDKEIEWINSNLDLSNYKDVKSILEEIISRPSGKNQGISNKTRKNIVIGLHYTLDNPPISLIDNIRRIEALEKSYMGISLSCSKLDLVEKVTADSFCKDFLDGKTGSLKLAVEIIRIKKIKTKKNNLDMAYLSVADDTAVIPDVVVFPDEYREYADLLYDENTVLLIGSSDNKGSFILKKCYPL